MIAYSHYDMVAIKLKKSGTNPTTEFILKYGDVISYWLDMFNKCLSHYTQNPRVIPTFNEASEKHDIWKSNKDELMDQYCKNDLPIDWEEIDNKTNHLKPNPVEDFVHEFSISNDDWQSSFEGALTYYDVIFNEYNDNVKKLMVNKEIDF